MIDWQIVVSALAAVSLITNIFFLWWNNRGKREATLSATLLNVLKAASLLTAEAEQARQEAQEIGRQIAADQRTLRRWQDPAAFQRTGSFP